MAEATYRVEPSAPRDQSRPHVGSGIGRAKGPVAIVVAHGMGQQAPFQTLDDLMTGLRRHQAAGASHGKSVAKTVVAGSERLQRLETVLALPDGSAREVHVYEAYWAPLTEGRVTLRDVMGFLLRGGMSGALCGLEPFRRWLFGKYVEFPAPVRVVLSFLIALAVVAALMGLNTLVVAVAAARVPLQTPPSWLSPVLFADLTTVLNALVAVFALFAIVLGLSWRTRRSRMSRRVLGPMSIAAFAAAIVATVAAAITAALVVVYHAISRGGGSLSFFSRTPLRPAAHPWLLALAWPVVIAVAAYARRFLIQYVGDVAAYVQPQVLDRFSELRQKIKDTVWRTARAVYSEPYEDLILVGHSLGSVVVYDVLNRLLIDEQVQADDAPPVAGRTRLLLTFGSPLDKTAFIFGVMGRRAEAREALAAAVQPLITQERIRPRWINIYSPWDLISGSLDFYDLPDRSNLGPVENRRDPEATTLLAAHMEYWHNAILFKTILENLTSHEEREGLSSVRGHE